MFTEQLREKAEELVGRYPGKRSALLPLLHLVQHQHGCVTDEGVAECAELLGLTKAEVWAVATFYTMFKREPMGEHLVSVCTNFACKARGGEEVYRRLSEYLGVGHEGTTDDGRITLEHAECLGNCEGAPLVTVDYLNYERLGPDDAVDLVDRLRAGDPPEPTRGTVPPGVRAVSHQLAGLGPVDPSAPGRATDQARADDGGLPHVEAGPGATPLPIQPVFGPAERAQRAAAKREVAAAGHEAEDLEREAGPSAREFPSTDPDEEQDPPGGRRGQGPAAPGEPDRRAATDDRADEADDRADEADDRAEEADDRADEADDGEGRDG